MLQVIGRMYERISAWREGKAMTTARKLKVISIFLCLLGSAVPFHGQNAPSVPFQPAVTVDGGGLGPMSHSMAVAADGTIYVAHDILSFDGRSSVYVAISRDGGKTWSNRFIGFPQARWPRVAVAPNGEVDVVYLDGKDCIGGGTTLCSKPNPLPQAVQFVRSLDKGATFSSPLALSTPGATRVSEPDVAVDGAGKV